MRENLNTEGRRWLEQAQTDLKWCRHLHKEGVHYQVCFLPQQTAEKALKAFFYSQGVELVTGLPVRQFCTRAAGYSTNFQDRLDSWAILDSYYIPTRYPNSLPDDIPARIYNMETIEKALILAEAVITKVEAWFA